MISDVAVRLRFCDTGTGAKVKSAALRPTPGMYRLGVIIQKKTLAAFKPSGLQHSNVRVLPSRIIADRPDVQALPGV